MCERAGIIVPLRLGARARDRAGDQRVVEHPKHRELARRHAAFFRVAFDFLRKRQRFRPPLGL